MNLSESDIKTKKIAIAFHDWFMKINKMGSETRKSIYAKHDHVPTTEDFYNYLTNNKKKKHE